MVMERGMHVVMGRSMQWSRWEVPVHVVSVQSPSAAASPPDRRWPPHGSCC